MTTKEWSRFGRIEWIRFLNKQKRGNPLNSHLRLILLLGPKRDGREKKNHCCEESYPIYRLYHTTLSTNSERGQVQMNPSPPLRNHLRLLPPLSSGYYRDRRRRRRRRFFRVSLLTLLLLSRAKLVGRSRRGVLFSLPWTARAHSSPTRATRPFPHLGSN